MLYGKLHILHISVVILKFLTYILKLSESLRELLFHLGYLHGCTNTGHNVLTLCIGKELTEEALITRSGITRKCNTGTAVIAHITEGHRLYVNGRTP